MRKLSMILMLMLCLQIATACNLTADVGGKEVARADIGGGTNSEFKYDFTCNGCHTGEQKFSSQSDMCSALLDESRNQSCCRRDREDYYKAQSCP